MLRRASLRSPNSAMLQLVLARLFADPETPSPRFLALALDARLAEGKSDGWRYEPCRPDGEAARLGLQG